MTGAVIDAQDWPSLHPQPKIIFKPDSLSSMVYGPWSLVPGLWSLVPGLCSIPPSMVHGPWSMVHPPLRITHQHIPFLKLNTKLLQLFKHRSIDLFFRWDLHPFQICFSFKDQFGSNGNRQTHSFTHSRVA